MPNQRIESVWYPTIVHKMCTYKDTYTDGYAAILTLKPFDFNDEQTVYHTVPPS